MCSSVFGSVLQCVAVSLDSGGLQCVAVCVAVCCSGLDSGVLQCVAECVAVCCSVS